MAGSHEHWPDTDRLPSTWHIPGRRDPSNVPFRRPIRVTFDTNCLIALDEGRAESTFLRRILDSRGATGVVIGVPAIAASERRRDGGSLASYRDFSARLATLGLEDSRELYPLGYFDLTYLDRCLMGTRESLSNRSLEPSIHAILFPGIEFDYTDFCAARGLSYDTIHRKWRNAKCDVLSLWCHIYYQGDIFVTNDDNFHSSSKKDRLFELGARAIERPHTAWTWIADELGLAVEHPPT